MVQLILVNCLNKSITCLVHPELVVKPILKLKSSSSGGPDGLSDSFFKVTSDSIALPLSIIFYLSLQSGIIPDTWRHVSVVPVFKKGHRVIHAIIYRFIYLYRFVLHANSWKVV